MHVSFVKSTALCMVGAKKQTAQFALPHNLPMFMYVSCPFKSGNITFRLELCSPDAIVWVTGLELLDLPSCRP